MTYKDKEKQREYNRKYRETHKERIKEQELRYREKNKKKRKETYQNYYKKNKDRLKEKNNERARKYYKDNKDKVREKQKNYYKKNREKLKKYQHGLRQERINKYYTNIECVVCGSTDKLVYHHKNSYDKIDDIRHISLELIDAEIKKCVVLCRSHHRILHATKKYKGLDCYIVINEMKKLE